MKKFLLSALFLSILAAMFIFLPQAVWAVRENVIMNDLKTAHEIWKENNTNPSSADGYYVYQVGKEPVITDPDFVREVLNEVGGQDVTFTITNSDLNCGYTQSLNNGGPEGGGCFSSITPRNIYISENLESIEETRALIIHEYAHILQFEETAAHRPGALRLFDTLLEDMNNKSSETKEAERMAYECEADTRAMELGALKETLLYQVQGVCD